jgi:hypothetical protein
MANTFKPILNRAAQLCGVDVSEIPDTFFRSVRDFATSRIAWAWDAAQWPETLEIVEVPFVEGVGDMPDGYQLIVALYRYSPTEKLSAPVRFSRIGTEIVCHSAGTATMYALAKVNAPTFVGEVYSADTTYAEGDQSYSSGSFWTAGASVTGAPPSNGWTEISVPTRMVNYCAVGVCADILRAQDKHEPAVAMEAQAEGALALELDKFYNQEGQAPQSTILTR